MPIKNIEDLERIKTKIAMLRLTERINNFKEVDLGPYKNLPVKETSRYLRCDLETEVGKKQFELGGIKNG